MIIRLQEKVENTIFGLKVTRRMSITTKVKYGQGKFIMLILHILMSRYFGKNKWKS